MTQADFLKAPFPAASRACPWPKRTGPRRFFNRELSWLAFNWRVLEEAANPRVPLLERLRFLSISPPTWTNSTPSASRACARWSRDGQRHACPKTGCSPAEQLAADQRRRAAPDADAADHLQHARKRDGGRRASSLLTRVEADGARPEASGSALPEQGLSGAVAAGHRPGAPVPVHPEHRLLRWRWNWSASRDQRPLQALLPIPQQIARFVPLPAKAGEHRFLPLEELLLLHLGMLFPGYTDKGHCTFRVLRDSDLEVEDEAEDLVREFETALKRRRRGEVIRLKMSAGAPEDLRALIMEELAVTEDEVVEVQGPAGRGRPEGTGAGQPPRPAVAALHPARARTGAGPRRRHVRRDPAEGHAAASPLRDLRHGDPLSGTGGARPERAGDQADAVPHQLGQPDRRRRCARRPRRASR